MKFLKLSLASIIASTGLFAGTYNVDLDHSHVGFKIKHMMISNVKGSFDKFEGVIEYDEATKTLKAINGTINVNSINTANEKRDDHLRAPDMFDAVKYPNITFVLKSVKGDYVYGDITIRGITKEVKLELSNNGIVIDPWGNQRVGIALEGKVNRKDFEITWNKVLEAGGVAVGDDVKLEIELEGILAK
ncbi:MAG: YceI family protein [Arcobacteraceae bacterium]